MTATRAVNGYLKERLIAVVRWHALAGDSAAGVWHETRFFERWASEAAFAAFANGYARYDTEDVSRALLHTVDAFERFERETAARLGLEAPRSRARVRELIAAALAGTGGSRHVL